MNKQAKRNNKLSRKVVLRAIEKSIDDQKALLEKAKKLVSHSR